MINTSFEDDEKLGQISTISMHDLTKEGLYAGKTTKPTNVESQNQNAEHHSIYDPYNFGNNKNPTSFVAAVLHLVVVCLGPTLLSIPSTFIDVGYITGFFGTLLTVLFYVYCLRSFVSAEYELCKRLKVQNMTYIEVVFNAFEHGPNYTRWLAGYTKYLIYAAFVSVWIGGNSIFILLACENLKSIYDYIFHVDISVRLMLIYLTVPLILLCWIPNLKWLMPCSAFSNIMNTISIIAIIYDVIREFPNTLNTRQAFGNLSSIPLFIGTVLFTINTTGLVMPLKNEMKSPKVFNATLGVLNVTYIPVSLLYSFFGLLCYLRYGNDTKISVVLNLPDTTCYKFIIGSYGLGICFLYPIAAYVSFDIIWNCILKEKFLQSQFIVLYEYFVRTGVALSSILLVFIVPNLELFLSLTGTLATSIDSIIFPALVEILVFSKKGEYALLLKNIIILLVAGLLAITGTVNCTINIIDYYFPSES